MLATGLAVVLMAGAPLPRRGMRIALGALLLVGATSVVARIALPPVGETYTDAAG